jgi:hypothetical protein
VLQVLYGLSDDHAEFQILDRRSFGRFLGLDDSNRVPDAKTIWLFRGQLTRAGAVQRLFDRFGLPDRRRHRDRGAPPAAEHRREGDDQGRRHTRALVEGQARADGPRRPLDAEARPQEAAPGRQCPMGRFEEPLV